MKYSWNPEEAEARINNSCEQVKEVNIIQYTKEKSLQNIKVNEAYEMDAVHMYVDILNLEDMLVNQFGNETETSHLRALRFFDSHFKAIKYILKETHSIFVDFHNQRLHAVIPKPYDNEQQRLDRAVTIAQIIIDVVEQQRDSGVDDIIEAAKLRIGIDTGKALAVNNGRKANKEPLFLGDPANHAAKHSSGTAQGIYLTEKSREVLVLDKVENTKSVRMKKSEIDRSILRSGIENQDLVNKTIQEVKEHTKKLSDFEFSRVTPTFESLDFLGFTRKNSKRQEMVSIYADIDGFTNYISENIATLDGQKDIVRCLHVLRSELDGCLNKEFLGRRVRFIGDCIHGILCEGTTKTTNAPLSVNTALEASAAIRSSFTLAQDILQDTFNISCDLGLAIGFDLGETMLSRVGRIDDNSRFSLGLSTINSENEQKRCGGHQTAIGEGAYSHLEDDYKNLFKDRIANDLTFDAVDEIQQNKIENDEESNLYSVNEAAPSILKAHVKF